MEKELSLEFLRTVENAAIASARTMGQGDREGSDQAAVEAMRKEMDRVGMDGTIVIGEGERDEAPMLFIGEKVGAAVRDKSRDYPKWTSLWTRWKAPIFARRANPAPIVVLAASEHGGLFHAPDLYMEKIIVGPPAKGAIDLDAPVKDNCARSRGATTATWRIWSSWCWTARATKSWSPIFAKQVHGSG